jgi:hypothetical protein
VEVGTKIKKREYVWVRGRAEWAKGFCCTADNKNDEAFSLPRTSCGGLSREKNIKILRSLEQLQKGRRNEKICDESPFGSS